MTPDPAQQADQACSLNEIMARWRYPVPRRLVPAAKHPLLWGGNNFSHATFLQMCLGEHQ